ncbi:MAG: choice-of-anchor Q domain-containing protein [Solirubrobacteraceae bacterium]
MRRLALLLALLAPASASAATRYATPTGTADGSCTRTAPCALASAIGGSAPGDTIFVRGGTYGIEPLVVPHRLTITAAPDAPRPVLRSGTAGAVALTVADGATGTVVEHLAISAPADGAVGVDLLAATALDDVTVTSGDAACLRSAAPGVRIDDAAFTQLRTSADPCLLTSGADTSWTGVDVEAISADLAASYSGDGTVTDATFRGQVTGLQVGGSAGVHRVTASGRDRGIVLSGTTMLTDSVAVARVGGTAVFAGSGNHELLNVTAWALGAGSSGIRTASGAEMTVKNTIARGVASDLRAEPATTAATSDCAVFTGCPASRIAVDHSNFRTGAYVEDLGSNQAGSPRFADAGFEDFRLRAGSPAIDAGSFEFNSGSADRAGRFRWLGASPDIGAYEYPAPRKAPRKTDRKAPTLGVVRLTSPSFRVARRGLAFAAAGAPLGSTLVFVVSEDSELVAQVRRPGARRSLGTIVRTAVRGTHRVYLSGRIDGRPLPPGRYVLTVMARDVAQNLSRPRVLTFTIVR